MTESRFPSSRPGWPATLVFSVAAAVLVVAAAGMMFTTFMFYDDEGYVLISLRNFAEHGRLYREVFSQYGPFPYVAYYALHLLGVPLTQTVGRLLTLVAWSGAALACAAIVGHATRSLAARLAVLAGVFVYLWVMVSEPSHPGGLIAGLSAVLAWLGHRWIDMGRTQRWAVLAGVGTVALLLTKINVGAFAGLSTLAWLFLHFDRPAVRRWVPAVLAVGVIVFPFALMRPLLGTPWAFTFATMFAFAGITAVGAAALDTTERTSWQTVRAGVLAALASGVIVCAVVFARGTTPGDLLDGVLLRPFRHPVHFNLTFVWPPGTLVAAAVAAALFCGAWWLRRQRSATVDPLVAGLRLVAAIALVADVARFPAISPDNAVLAFAMPWVWIFLWPLAGENVSALAARRWVGLLFLGQCLHAFPVPGSQIAWGTFLVIPLTALGAWSAAKFLAARFAPDGNRTRVFAVTLQVVLVAFALNTGWQLVQIGRRYEGGTDLGLHGAERVRLPDRTTALYHVLTLNAVAHSDMLFSLPGMFSLNAWTGLPTPTLANVTHWFSLLDAPEQQAIIRSLEAHPRACIIIQRGHLKFLAERGFTPSGPLNDYVASHFEPAFTIDEFEFCVRQGRRIAPFGTATLLERPRRAAGQPDPDHSLLKLSLLLPADRAVASIELTAIDDQHAPLLVLNQANAKIQVTPITLQGDPAGPAEPRTFPLTLNRAVAVDCFFDRGNVPIGLNSTLVVLRDADGAQLALVRMLP